MWGRLPTCAAVGYRRRSAANAGGTLWVRPIDNRPQLAKLPHKVSLAGQGASYFFMKFRGPKVHPNRPRTAMVCPTWGIVSPTPAAFRGIRSPCAKFGAANLLREKEPLLGYWLALRTAWLYHEEDPGSRLSCRFWRPSPHQVRRNAM